MLIQTVNSDLTGREQRNPNNNEGVYLSQLKVSLSYWNVCLFLIISVKEIGIEMRSVWFLYVILPGLCSRPLRSFKGNSGGEAPMDLQPVWYQRGRIHYKGRDEGCCYSHIWANGQLYRADVGRGSCSVQSRQSIPGLSLELALKSVFSAYNKTKIIILILFLPFCSLPL